MARPARHTVLLMRHPETPANTDRFFSGRLDIGITPRGEKMRERAVSAGVAFAPDRVWTSPLRRCHGIADAVAEQLGISSVPNDNLIEIDFGELEGTTFAPGWISGGVFPWPVDEFGVSHPSHGAESFEHAFERAYALFDQLRPLEGRTLCVTHGGIMRCIMGALYGMPKDRFWYMNIDNVSSIALTCDGERICLDAFGLTPEEVADRYAGRR